MFKSQVIGQSDCFFISTSRKDVKQIYDLYTYYAFGMRSTERSNLEHQINFVFVRIFGRYNQFYSFSSIAPISNNLNFAEIQRKLLDEITILITYNKHHMHIRAKYLETLKNLLAFCDNRKDNQQSHHIFIFLIHMKTERSTSQQLPLYRNFAILCHQLFKSTEQYDLIVARFTNFRGKLTFVRNYTTTAQY